MGASLPGRNTMDDCTTYPPKLSCGTDVPPPPAVPIIPQTGADFGALPVILLLLAAGVMLVVAGWRR